MSIPVVLSCPFCHQKSEYHDAPPNSTVRCLECSSIFRVPATVLHKHRPGTVHQGEQIRKGKMKYVVIAVVTVAVLAGGYLAWAKWLKPQPVAGDPFAGVANMLPEQSPEGAVQRFLEAWKMGDIKLLLKCCRASNIPKDANKDFDDRVQSWFGNYQLTGYRNLKVKRSDADWYVDFVVDVDAVDVRTKAAMKGTMTPRAVLDRFDTPTGKTSEWKVDMETAAPRWEN